MKKIGIVVVTFNSGDYVLECLESVFRSEGVMPVVVVVDNNSEDATVEGIVNWANGTREVHIGPASPVVMGARHQKSIDFEMRGSEPGEAPSKPLTIVRNDLNGGFAFGVNCGLDSLLKDETIEDFLLLNPDCVLPGDAAFGMLQCAAKGPYGMIGVRQIFYETPDVIQSDGFRLDRRFGVCVSVNARAAVATSALPADAELDFVSGACMLLSRTLLRQAGPLDEDYFLYYEETDLSMAKGKLPVRLARDVVVYHYGGTSIGSATTNQRSSPFANYFGMKSRMRFMRKHFPHRVWMAALYSLAKAASILNHPAGAHAMAAGILGLPPPKAVSDKIRDPRTRRIAFGKGHGQPNA